VTYGLLAEMASWYLSAKIAALIISIFGNLLLAASGYFPRGGKL